MIDPVSLGLGVAGAGINILGGIFGSNDAKAQAENQREWAEYNAQVQYGVDVNNIKSQTAITELNAFVLNETTTASNQMNTALTEYNAMVIQTNAQINDLLYEEDLANMWEEAELDMFLIGNQRAKERGNIEAIQSASGTTMGQDSNADVIIDQMTQESLDLTIIKTDAWRQADLINNARAVSMYQSKQEYDKILFEGRLQNQNSSLNASLQSSAMLAENMIRETSNMTSAEFARDSAYSNAVGTEAQQKAAADSNFVAGLFKTGANLTANVMSAYTPSSGGSTTTAITGGSTGAVNMPSNISLPSTGTAKLPTSSVNLPTTVLGGQ